MSNNLEYETIDTAILNDIIDNFNFAEQCYKELQQYIGLIDSQIQNEYRYIARAVVSLIKYLNDNSEGTTISINNQDIDYFVIDFHSSTRHLINDTLDLTISLAMSCINSIQLEFDLVPLISVYANYPKLIKSLKHINNKIAISRNERGRKRVAIYKEIFQSDELSEVKDFLDFLPEIYSNAKEAQLKASNASNLKLLSLTIPTGILLIGFLALLYNVLAIDGYMISILAFSIVFLVSVHIIYVFFSKKKNKEKTIENNRIAKLIQSERDDLIE